MKKQSAKLAAMLTAMLLCLCFIASPLTDAAASGAVKGMPFGYSLLTGGQAPLAQTTIGTKVLVPTKPGRVRYTGGNAAVDASNIAEGYIMAMYNGSAPRAKVRITRVGGSTYTYDLCTSGAYEVYPLTSGSGTYQVQVFYNVSGDGYALALSQDMEVVLRDERLPFLYPNQFVNFTEESKAVAKGAELAVGADGDLAIITAVYNYVIENIGYDGTKAQQVKEGKLNGYVPNVDQVLASGKGICFDYAALMAAMLRSQQIPTRMEFGYVSGGIYHAWISTYVTGVGWVNGVIQFDGVSWKLMDPTFAASSGSSSQIMQFIGNGSNYQTAFMY